MNRFNAFFPALVRMALGVIFIYAAVIKIADPVGFAGSIAAYKILPYFGNYLAAAVLPFVELLCGLLLVSGYRIRAGAAMIAVLNLLFIAALASAIARGLDIDCGCFKQGGGKTSPWLALGRDLVFLAMTALVLFTERRTGPRADTVEPPRPVGEGEG